MANPAESGPAAGTVAGTAQPPGVLPGALSDAGTGSAGRALAAPGVRWTPQPFHGRPVSWFAVSIVILAFVLGGIALIVGPTWWLFWVGVGLAVLGALIAAATDIFEDWY